MKPKKRGTVVSRDAEWLLRIAVKESRAKLAMPNNNAPLGAKFFVDCLEYLLNSSTRQRAKIHTLNKEVELKTAQLREEVKELRKALRRIQIQGSGPGFTEYEIAAAALRRRK